MPSEGTQLIAFRAGTLTAALAARAHGEPLSAIARRDLERYYYQIRLALPALSVPQASLIVDALNGTMTEPHTAHLLWAEIEDSLGDGLAEKWEVDGPALVAQLRRLTPFEALAVCDAVECVWNRIPHGEDLDTVLREVGLVRDEERTLR